MRTRRKGEQASALRELYEIQVVHPGRSSFAECLVNRAISNANCSWPQHRPATLPLPQLQLGLITTKAPLSFLTKPLGLEPTAATLARFL